MTGGIEHLDPVIRRGYTANQFVFVSTLVQPLQQGVERADFNGEPLVDGRDRWVGHGPDAKLDFVGPEPGGFVRVLRNRGRPMEPQNLPIEFDHLLEVDLIRFEFDVIDCDESCWISRPCLHGQQRPRKPFRS